MRNVWIVSCLLSLNVGCSNDDAPADASTDTGGCTKSECADARVDPCPGSACPKDAASVDDANCQSDVCDSVDAGPNSHILEIRAGRHHTCVRLHEGSVYCWGQGAYRALGGDYNAQHEPRRIEAFADARAIESGRRFGCAIREGGGVWCWGENHAGQIGDHATIPCGDCTPLPECADSACVAEPKAMAGLESNQVALALGEDFGCSLREDGRILCWGANTHGQVAQASLTATYPPTLVDSIEGARQISAGASHACALIGRPGSVMCWGRNDRAQVGNGETSDAAPVPSAVGDLDDAVEVVAGGNHSCARKQNGQVVCWGYNYLGALGNGSTRPTRATSPQTVVELDDAVELAAGEYFTCARRADATMVCWGNNNYGQLGDGTATGDNCADRECKTSPVPVVGLGNLVTINAGHLHACAANSTGEMWCWGYNLGAQLGTGEVTRGATPVPQAVINLP